MCPNDAWLIQSEVSGTCPLICWHMPLCACIFKGERVMLHKCVSVVMCEMAIVLQSVSIKLFRDVATSLNLSLKTDHMFLSLSLDLVLSHDPDTGNALDWTCCFCWLSICLGFHSICRSWFIVRSYYRLSSLAVTSVDGCVLYIIIHNSISCRAWL